MSGKLESFNPSPVLARKKDLSVTSNSETVNLHVNSCFVNPVLFAKGYLQKKSVNPSYCYHCQKKVCERCCLCISLDLCKSQISQLLLQIRGQIILVFEDLGSPRGQPQSGNSTQRGLHPPLPVTAKFDQVTNYHKLLCKSSQEPLLVGGIASAFEQKCCGTGSKSKISKVLKQTVSCTQTQQPVETHLGLEHVEHLPNMQSFKMETPETIRTSIQSGCWVTSIDFKDACLKRPHTNTQSVQEVYAFSHPGPVLLVKSNTLWPVHSSHGIHSVGQRG